MPPTEPKRGPARLQLALVAALFFGPLIVAAWLYYGGKFTPTAHSNHGVLVEPVLHLPDAHPALQDVAEGQWLLVYATDVECSGDCAEALHVLHQARLMLGNDMTRVRRVFLRGSSAPDRVLFDGQDDGLELLNDSNLSVDLWSALPDDTMRGGFFLIDPMGNLVMYFRPTLDPREMVDDIKHLLKLSRIG